MVGSLANIMSSMVEDRSLDSFFFVGLQEYMEEDLERLNKKMNWNLKNRKFHTTQEYCPKYNIYIYIYKRFPRR